MKVQIKGSFVRISLMSFIKRLPFLNQFNFKNDITDKTNNEKASAGTEALNDK